MLKLDKKTILIIVALGIILLFVTGFSVKKLFKGNKSALSKELKQEKQEIKAEKKVIDQKLQESEIFDPKQLTEKSVSKQLPADTANEIVRKLHYELIFWGGRPSKMNGYFLNLANQVQIAQITAIYAAKYNRSLTTDISKYMTKSQVQELYGIMSKLPS